MNPLETYLKDMRDIRSTGAAVAETSYYPALSNLLNEVGKGLKPRVRCVITLANRGAGLPDVGLFTPDQFQKATDAAPKSGQLPARGVLEVKGPADDVTKVARSEQVKRYVKEYGLVLVTNYRDFLLLGRDAQDNGLPLEGFTIAGDEKAFWQAAAHPQKTAQEQGEQFCEYLKRAMLSIAPLSAPQDLAWFLASYARTARARVETHKNLSALASVRDALEEALGMKFTDEKGEHFFRSTLVQTIFYGVFSAWVLWHRERPDRTDAFDWRVSAWSLRVPFIRALYDEIATPSKLGPLGLVEVLDWTAGALNRVDRGAFFRNFGGEHAVQYFYEPFLEAFDPELRKEMGVWLTPLEIVQYQVARVDTVLREELGLADGLADPNVIVIDFCCGTAAYLVEVLKCIARTLQAKGGDALMASDLKKAAMGRVFGFEIMPAPFVVAHLQLGLLLHEMGAPLSADGNERVGVYLTNSLTGWGPPKDPKSLLFPELAAERDAAEHVKRDKRILVVLGNPPYNAFAGVSPEEEQGLVEPYKRDLNAAPAAGGWGIRKFNLDDLYVRFFRLAERRIAEMTGQGVVSFISNFSYLTDPSFVVMRQRFLGEFDKLWLDCMNGDSRETGKLTPEGKPDPSVFSTDYNREGIRVGTAICVVVRKGKREDKPVVRFRHFWGATKREDLLASLTARNINAAYAPARPCKENRYSFRPEDVSAAYTAWAKIPELSAVPPFNGPVERRGNSLIAIRGEEQKLQLLADFLDPTRSDEAVRAVQPAFMRSSGEYHAEDARAKLKGKVAFSPQRICSYPFKPLDVRSAYLDPDIHPLFSRPSPQLLHQQFAGNAFLITRDTADKTPEGPPFYFSALVCDYDCISGHARHFPLLIRNGNRLKKKLHATLFDAAGASMEQDRATANLSRKTRAYLAALSIRDPDADAEAAGLIWVHALAVGYSPAYLAENADGIRRDWPRVPLPDSRKALNKSAGLGRRVAALLNTEADVCGVTASPLEPIFRTVGVLANVGGGALNADAGDLAVAAGWGHAGKDGATMPGKGKTVQRMYDKAELEAITDAAKAQGISRKQALALLGGDTRDVYLNDKAYYRNVPANVWEQFIGGYQVIKKWLSYREQELLGRALRGEEAREVTGMARRLAAIILLQPALDDNYQAVKANTYEWPTGEQ